MCVRCNVYYPLVYDRFNDEKKVLFKNSFEFRNKDDHKLFYQYRINQKDLLLGKGYDVLDFIHVPCGICSECLNNKARNWVSRLMLESRLHQFNYFVTLTYDDLFLTSHNLVPDDFTSFMKKFRINLQRDFNYTGLRFYGVGEYGEQFARPHFHIIIFSDIDLSKDFKYYKKNEFGDILYTSDYLSNIWKKGFVTIGDVSPSSCAYVARYTEKKQLLTSKQKDDLIKKGIVPEFSRMSRRPGIAAEFLDLAIDKFLDNEKLVISKGISDMPYYFIKKGKEKELININRDKSNLKLNKAFYMTGLYLGDYLLINDEIKLKNKNKRAL